MFNRYGDLNHKSSNSWSGVDMAPDAMFKIAGEYCNFAEF